MRDETKTMVANSERAPEEEINTLVEEILAKFTALNRENQANLLSLVDILEAGPHGPREV